jgi:hypothetical protein
MDYLWLEKWIEEMKELIETLRAHARCVNTEVQAERLIWLETNKIRFHIGFLVRFVILL